MPPVSVKSSGGSAAASLYDRDFYAWTQEQARLLRLGRLDVLDTLNLLEEIESLGRKEVAELRSRLRILLAHLLKTMCQPERATRSWATTILNQRIAIADHLVDNPSLKPRLSEVFLESYANARDLAASETGLALERFPENPPFTSAEALSRTWSVREDARGVATR